MNYLTRLYESLTYRTPNRVFELGIFKLYNGRQKIDYRKIKRWRIRVNVSNNYYKNFESD